MRIETLDTLHLLLQFKNQQVVINFYEEDELVHREGLFFETIHISENQLQFYRNSTLIFSFGFDGNMNFSQRTEFKNYFSFVKDRNQIDLYFP